MNKFLIALLIAGFSSTAMAQMYVGGGVHGVVVEEGSEADFVKGMQAYVGYQVAPHLLVEMGIGATKANDTNVDTQYGRLSFVPFVDVTEKTRLYGRVSYVVSTSNDWDSNFENELTDPISASSHLDGEGDYRDGFMVSVGAFYEIADQWKVRVGVGTKINDHVDNFGASIGIVRDF